MNINKQAVDAHPLWALVPGSSLFGLEVNPADFPKVPFAGTSSGAAAFWHTLGSLATVSAIAAIGKGIITKHQEEAFDSYKNAINTNKVNSLHSYNTPNYAAQTRGVSKVRELGIKKSDKSEDGDDKKGQEKKASAIAKQSDALDLVVPLVSIPAGIMVGNVVGDALVKRRGKKLEEEILKNRNDLDALYARLLKNTQKPKKKKSSKKKKDAEEVFGVRPPADDLMFKAAADKDDGPGLLGLMGKGFGWLTNTGSSMLTRAEAIALGGVALAMGASGLAAYTYTKNKDKNRKKVKVLKEKILPKNLTNAPAEVQILLGKGNKIPKDIREQTYLKNEEKDA